MALKAFIFDVDGTLAETEKNGHRVAFNLAFKEDCLPWQWSVDLYGDLLEIGGGKERLGYYLSHYQAQFNPDEELDTFIRRVHQNKSRYYRQLLENNSIPLRLGVERFISEVYQAGIKLAIASTASIENVKALLENSLDGEMANLFSVIAAGDMVQKKKPAPDIYLLALEQLNLLPEECLAIEDTNQGLIAATQADLKTVVTVNEYTQNQDFKLANLVLNHLGEVSNPFTVIQGNSHNYDYFNLDLACML